MKKRYILLVTLVVGLVALTLSVAIKHRAEDRRNGGEIPLDDQHLQTHPTDLYGDPLPLGAVARLGTLRLRAAGSTVAFSRDGQRVISFDWPEFVRISDIDTGRTQFERSAVMAVHSDGEYINVVDHAGKLIQCRPDKPDKVLFDVTGEKEAWVAADFSDDGSRLATCLIDLNDPSQNTTIQVWDVAKGKKTLTLPVGSFEGSMTSVRSSPDGDYLAELSNQTVSLWNLTTATQHQIVETSRRGVVTAVFSPDSEILATASEQLRFWEVATGQELSTPSVEEFGRAVAFSPDGTTLVFEGNSGGMFHFCDAATGELKRQIRAVSPGQEIYCVAFSPDGKKIAASTSSGWTRLWDVSSGKELLPFPRHEASIQTIAFSRNGARVITASRDRTVRVWDALTGKHLYRIDERMPVKHIRAFAVSPSGATLAVTDDDTLRFYDFTTGTETGSLPSVDGRIAAVAFARDDDTLLTISIDSKPLKLGDIWRDAMTLRQFDRRSGRVSMTVPIQTNLENTVFSPDGRTLLTAAFTGTEYQTLVLDSESGMIRRAFSGGLFAPSSDFESVAVLGRDGHIRRFEVSTGEEIRDFGELASNFLGMMFSPDESLLAINLTESIRIFDTSLGLLVTEIESPSSGTRAVAFSPDSTLLAVEGEVGEVLIWDLAMID